jgi:hypothetical protein
MYDPGDRASTDNVDDAVEIYAPDNEDTYIVYDSDGEQHCFVYDDE